MSGAFHVLTGWCSNRPNEGCSGLERAWALLVLPPAGPFVLYRVVSLVGARNQTAGKQVFHFLDDLFHTSWKTWLGLPRCLPVLCHLMTLRGQLRENFIHTYFVYWAEFTSCKFCIKPAIEQHMLSAFQILFFVVVVQKTIFRMFSLCSF